MNKEDVALAYMGGVGATLIMTPWIIALLDGMFPQNELLNTAIFSIAGVLIFAISLSMKTKGETK